MNYLIYILITILIAYITYRIIKSNSTEYKTTTLEILRDTNNPLIKNKVVSKELKGYDVITIDKKEKFIFGKLKETKIIIYKSYYYKDNDMDEYC
jgi:hypothetical protein